MEELLICTKKLSTFKSKYKKMLFAGHRPTLSSPFPLWFVGV